MPREKVMPQFAWFESLEKVPESLKGLCYTCEHTLTNAPKGYDLAPPKLPGVAILQSISDLVILNCLKQKDCIQPYTRLNMIKVILNQTTGDIHVLNRNSDLLLFIFKKI